MKTLVRTSVVILLAATSFYGQELRQNGNSAGTVKEPSQRPIAILKEPTVLGTGDTWAVISWTTNTAGKANARVYAGTDQKNMKPIAQILADPANNGVESYQEQEYSHLVRLNNLKPGTTYYFQADSGSISEHSPASKSNVWKFTTSGVAPATTATLSASKRPVRKPRATEASVQQNPASANPASASLHRSAVAENIVAGSHTQ